MRKTINSLFLMPLAVIGMLMFTACGSNDDVDKTPVIAEPEDKGSSVPSDPMTSAVGKLNTSLSGLDFQELAPLANAIESEQTTRGGADDMLSEFQSKLMSLLDALFKSNFNLTLPYGARFNYESYNNVLNLSWDLAGTLKAGRESSTYFLGKHTTLTGDAQYQSADGSVYVISAVMDKDVDLRNWSYTIQGARQLVITKNGEQLLRIVSDSESNRPMYNPFKVRSSMAGEVIYRDYDITLTYNHPHTHERYAVLGYGKVGEEQPMMVMETKLTDDAGFFDFITGNAVFAADFSVKAIDGLLLLKGTSENVAYLVRTGIELSRCMSEGSTEEHCAELVKGMNENLKMQLYLSELLLGDIYVDCQYDAEAATFRPVFMMQSELLGGSVNISQMLASMGVSLDDLLSLGKLTE